MASRRRSDISEGLRKLQCRSLIFVGDMSPFHADALHMTSKLDRRLSALVEVCKIVPSNVNRWRDSLSAEMSLNLIGVVCGTTGSSMWVNGDRGAASCYVNTNGVLSHGIWLVQASEAKCQPKKSLESNLDFSRALFTREYGFETETNKNTNFGGNLERIWMSLGNSLLFLICLLNEFYNSVTSQKSGV